MIDYAKEIKEVDSKPKIKNKELIYIREKAKIHNLDTVAISLAENLVIIGLKGIDALSIVTKYRMVIKKNLNILICLLQMILITGIKRKKI